MSIRNKYLFTIFLTICSSILFAQNETTLDEFSNEQLGSIYYAYPRPSGKFTPIPNGYEPFYISHYGRHGSRWITSDERYTKVIDVFKSQDLTPLGENIKNRLELVWEDAQGRAGDLTPLGERQHKSIAERMYTNYPTVFKNDAYISARSSTSGRCIMSMSAFSERLKELNPQLRIVREANQRYMNYLAYTSPEGELFTSENAEWRKEFSEFEKKKINPQRLISSLFKYPEKIANKEELMMGLYWIASDMQNTELQLSFYDIFKKQEIFDIWQTINYRMYVSNACSPLNEGVMPQSAQSLLLNIIDSADDAILHTNVSATLRFGHDTYLIRLLSLMQIEECCNTEVDSKLYYKAWQDFKISPMAANLQIIFFKNAENNILVKFLLNEEEVNLPIMSRISPYYHWKDVRQYYQSLF